jgi:hypothetical protein
VETPLAAIPLVDADLLDAQLQEVDKLLELAAKIPPEATSDVLLEILAGLSEDDGCIQIERFTAVRTGEPWIRLSLDSRLLEGVAALRAAVRYAGVRA